MHRAIPPPAKLPFWNPSFLRHIAEDCYFLCTIGALAAVAYGWILKSPDGRGASARFPPATKDRFQPLPPPGLTLPHAAQCLTAQSATELLLQRPSRRSEALIAAGSLAKSFLPGGWLWPSQPSATSIARGCGSSDTTSGTVATGAVATGAVATGAVATGAVVSGAVVSGARGSGESAR